MIEAVRQNLEATGAAPWLAHVPTALAQTAGAAELLQRRVEALGARAEALARAMDFTFLFNPERAVFSIGYNHQTQRLDNSYYDLLASEARITSVVAIAANTLHTSSALGTLVIQATLPRAFHRGSRNSD